MPESASPSGADPHAVPRKGTLLVAGPRLLDPNFMHAVVLVCDHGAEGTFGLILNRPMPVTVGELGSEVPLLQGRRDRVWSGGPVSTGELQVIHCAGTGVLGALPVVDGVSFGGDPEVLRTALADAGAESVKFVLGYAGWGEGQLDAEMAEQAWIVVPATRRRIFDSHPETLWRRVLRAEGGDVAELADQPPDPSWN